jgi:hypothetical protein
MVVNVLNIFIHWKKSPYPKLINMRCAIKTFKQNIFATDAPAIRLIFSIVKAHIDELSSARIWQYELFLNSWKSIKFNRKENYSMHGYAYLVYVHLQTSIVFYLFYCKQF